MALVIFDVDHTITRSSTGRRLVECGRRAGLFSFRNLVVLPYYYLRYRMGKIDINELVRQFAKLEGHSETDLVDLAQGCYDLHVRGDIMREARDLVRRHQEAGDTVVFATSSLDIIVYPLARELGVTHVACTKIEFRDGMATGRLVGEPCFGEEKRRRVQALAADLAAQPPPGDSAKLSADTTDRVDPSGILARAIFYSDSALDLPLLEQVGTPIVVNPDLRLRRVAARRGWKHLEFS